MAKPSLRKKLAYARLVARAKLRRVPWFGRSKAGVPRRGQRFRLVRDVLGALLIVAIVLGGAYAASGGAWPPVIVIESGSMMHPDSETHYGRIGTIDVGDLLFVHTVKDPTHDIHTWADGGSYHYGRPGDVLVYQPFGLGNATPIIHRAIAFVEVKRGAGVTTTYTVHWTDHQLLVFNDSGIYMPELGFSEPFGYTPQDGYKPQYSGYITKGDNPVTNPVADQVGGISDLVDPLWIIGTAHGEIPWLGLARLATQSGTTNPEQNGWIRVGNAFAPLELWTMFFVSLGLLILIPLAWDTWKLVREHRRRQAEVRRLEREQHVLDERPLDAFEVLPE